MEAIFFITTVVGFVVIIVTVLILSYLEKRDNTKKDVSIAKLLRLVDQGAILTVEQEPVIEEEQEEEALVDISDMPSLQIDKEQ